VSAKPRPTDIVGIAPEVRRDLARTTLAVLIIVGLLAASLWIIRPFLLALIWSAMVVVATWPLMIRMQRVLWNRRWLATTVMITALLLAFVMPLLIALSTIIDNANEISDGVESLKHAKLPDPPRWVEALPFVGPKASSAWQELSSKGSEEITQRLAPYARAVVPWFIAQLGSWGIIILQFLLTLIISAILFAHGESAVAGARDFCHRLAGARGGEVVQLAGQAIRGVALGVVVTALVQAVLGGIGLALAHVPFALILTVLMFILAVAQIGPGPVLIGALAWVYWKGDSGWVTVLLLLWSLFVVSIDNVLRPILIQKGGDLPLLLVFAGVIGGLLAFGLVGIFVGPVVLAVSYRLLASWVREGGDEAPP
jgi:predicted PurR-regulated permease PerM